MQLCGNVTPMGATSSMKAGRELAGKMLTIKVMIEFGATSVGESSMRYGTVVRNSGSKSPSFVQTMSEAPVGFEFCSMVLLPTATSIVQGVPANLALSCGPCPAKSTKRVSSYGTSCSRGRDKVARKCPESSGSASVVFKAFLPKDPSADTLLRADPARTRLKADAMRNMSPTSAGTLTFTMRMTWAVVPQCGGNVARMSPVSNVVWPRLTR
mmetsp:Transcript_164002/g.521405  ORF Transcript_164002/g.521405 Transcript_164002/m.521405 type:complete len:212 (+) Transcript_164002:1522-2157(+)